MSFEPLDVFDIPAATLVPCRRPDPTKPIIGGVLDRHGGVVAPSLLERTKGRIVVLSEADRPAKVDDLPGEYLFGGYLYGLYGHFLLESCSRLWATRRFDDSLPVAWLLDAAMHPYQRAIFDRIGVRNPHVFIVRPTRVGMLHVPEPAYRLEGWCHPAMPELMGCCTHRAEPGVKVWLSRSQLPDHLATIEGEAEVERRLSDLGWRIWHPERESVGDQLDMLARAERVAGFSGSAFHTMIMIRDFRGKVTMFNRGVYIHKDFQAIAAARSFDLEIVIAPMKRKEERPGNRTSFTLRSVDDVIRHLV